MVDQIRLTGAAELAKVLEQLPEHIAKKVLARALKVGGEVVREAAEVTAPRDKGQLKADLIVKPVRGSSGTSAAVHVGPSSRSFYGLFTEIGTKHILPLRWLTRAFDFSAEHALCALGESLGKEIERAAVRLAGPYAKSGARPGRFKR
jgi:HK97 gp10 family phage protein